MIRKESSDDMLPMPETLMLSKDFSFNPLAAAAG